MHRSGLGLGILVGEATTAAQMHDEPTKMMEMQFEGEWMPLWQQYQQFRQPRMTSKEMMMRFQRGNSLRWLHF